MPSTTLAGPSKTAAAGVSPMEMVFAGQRAAFTANPYPPLAERRANLEKLLDAVLARRDAIAQAIDRDFGCRSRHEVMFSEIYVSVNTIRHARRHLKEWMAPRPRAVAWPLQFARAYVMPQPAGVVGIIAPWNYPVFLSIGPIAAALAAGNRVMLKPSEHTPRTSELLAGMIAETFPDELVTAVTGDTATGAAFASLPFDHLLFTGSTAVGREVMKAAAENLTPVTLELGGKSPALVAADADLDLAAADIAYGKLLNAGQTCIAPDYALVPSGMLQAFTGALRNAVERYYPNPGENEEYTSIVSDRHYLRLRSYLDEARRLGVETIQLGAEATPGNRKFPPALVIDPPEALALMREEIFGPILPVKPYNSLEEALAYINSRPRPLALYVFARNRRVVDQVLARTVSGGVCVNDTLLHVAADDLPFGGAGASGIGQYHAREGFDTFSKLKPVFERRFFGLGRLLRPPYKTLHKWMEWILIR